MPARDAADTVALALRSVQRQTFADWECVVVDDGSVDGTWAELEVAARADERVRLFRQDALGVVAARNAGLAECRGEFVALLDADDYMSRRRLERQVAVLDANPSSAAVGCHMRVFPVSAQQEGMRGYERWLNAIATADDVRRNAFVECPVAHSSLVVRTEVLRDLGYRDEGWPEDYDLVLRMLAAGHEIVMAPQRLLHWRRTKDGLSHTHENYSIEAFTRCKADFLAGGFLAGGDAYGLWGYGGTGKALRRALEAHGKSLAYVVEIDPRRVGQTIHGAPVIAPIALRDRERVPLVVSVAGAQARRLIREVLADFGFEELRDYVVAA